MEAKQITIKALAASVSVVLAVELAARTALGPSLFALGLTRFVQTGLMLWVIQSVGQGMPSIGLARSQWPRGLRRGLVWSAAFGAAALCSFVLLQLAGMRPLVMIRMPLPSTVHALALFFLVGGVLAPVAEEIFFRGLVYGYFRKWGVALALIASTALFTLAHPLRGFPLTQMVGGLLFALAYEKEKNLFVPIIVHVLGNLAIFALSTLPVSV